MSLGGGSYRMTIRSGSAEHHLDYSKRDMRVLHSKQLPEGEAFIVAAGVYANFTVARGQDTSAWVVRDRAAFLVAAQALMDKVASDWALLSRDYAYRMPWQRSYSKRSSENGFGMHGVLGSLWPGPGQLYIKLMEVGPDGLGRHVGMIDLRPEGRYMTDSGGEIRIKRVTADLGWLQSLPALIAFLERVDAEHVEVRHHYENPGSV